MSQEPKIIFRLAEERDVPFIVELLANDKLGALREDFRDPLPRSYAHAYERISQDPNQELTVATDANGAVLGTFQLTLIPYLTYRGGIRAQIEAVRVRADQRGQGLGEKLLRHAIARAQERGAHLVQLTTDKQRPEAARFYEKLGFRATHEGMKLHF